MYHNINITLACVCECSSKHIVFLHMTLICMLIPMTGITWLKYSSCRRRVVDIQYICPIFKQSLIIPCHWSIKLIDEEDKYILIYIVVISDLNSAYSLYTRFVEWIAQKHIAIKWWLASSLMAFHIHCYLNVSFWD